MKQKHQDRLAAAFAASFTMLSILCRRYWSSLAYNELSEEKPDKLRELVDLWWTEAGKYGVLTLDGRSTPRKIQAIREGRQRQKGASWRVYYPSWTRIIPMSHLICLTNRLKYRRKLRGGTQKSKGRLLPTGIFAWLFAVHQGQSVSLLLQLFGYRKVRYYIG